MKKPVTTLIVLIVTVLFVYTVPVLVHFVEYSNDIKDPVISDCYLINYGKYKRSSLYDSKDTQKNRFGAYAIYLVTEVDDDKIVLTTNNYEYGPFSYASEKLQEFMLNDFSEFETKKSITISKKDLSKALYSKIILKIVKSGG